MNKFEIELLKLNYDSYQNTGSRYCTYRFKNANEFIYYTSAARYLDDDGLIEGISDNIFQSSISVFNNLLEFEITDKGINYVEQNLK